MESCCLFINWIRTWSRVINHHFIFFLKTFRIGFKIWLRFWYFNNFNILIRWRYHNSFGCVWRTYLIRSRTRKDKFFVIFFKIHSGLSWAEWCKWLFIFIFWMLYVRTWAELFGCGRSNMGLSSIKSMNKSHLWKKIIESLIYYLIKIRKNITFLKIILTRKKYFLWHKT